MFERNSHACSLDLKYIQANVFAYIFSHDRYISRVSTGYLSRFRSQASHCDITWIRRKCMRNILLMFSTFNQHVHNRTFYYLIKGREATSIINSLPIAIADAYWMGYCKEVHRLMAKSDENTSGHMSLTVNCAMELCALLRVYALTLVVNDDSYYDPNEIQFHRTSSRQV